MAEEWSTHPERFALNGITSNEYVELIINIIRRLNPNISIERFASQAPRQLLLHSPLGGLRLDALRKMIVDRMDELCATQGDLLGNR